MLNSLNSQIAVVQAIMLFVWIVHCLKMQWLRVGVFAGRALRQRQCTLEGAPVCKCMGSVHWEGVYSVRQCTLGCKIFIIDH